MDDPSRAGSGIWRSSTWQFAAVAGPALGGRLLGFRRATPAAGSVLGRVAAVNAVFIGSSNEIGAFESGVAARLLGAVPAVVLGGLVPMVVVAVVAWRLPQLRRLERVA